MQRAIIRADLNLRWRNTQDSQEFLHFSILPMKPRILFIFSLAFLTLAASSFAQDTNSSEPLTQLAGEIEELGGEAARID